MKRGAGRRGVVKLCVLMLGLEETGSRVGGVIDFGGGVLALSWVVRLWY
jgi:hypothetical protein